MLSILILNKIVFVFVWFHSPLSKLYLYLNWIVGRVADAYSKAQNMILILKIQKNIIRAAVEVKLYFNDYIIIITRN
jgi:hypothetical protein